MSTSGAVFVYYSRRSVFFLFPQMKTKLMLDSSNLFLKSVPSLPSYTALSFRVYAVLQTTNSSPENHMQLSFLTLDHDLGGGHYATLSFFSHFLLSLFLALALHYQQQHSIARISIFLVFSQFCRHSFFVLTHTRHCTCTLKLFSLSYFCCNFFISCFAPHTQQHETHNALLLHTLLALCAMHVRVSPFRFSSIARRRRPRYAQ